MRMTKHETKKRKAEAGEEQSGKPRMKVEDSGIDVGDTASSAELVEKGQDETIAPNVATEDKDFADWMLGSLNDDWTKDLDS
jgi:hypothetical protein